MARPTQDRVGPRQFRRELLLACVLSLLFLCLCYLRLWGDSHSAALNLLAVNPHLVRVFGTALGGNVARFVVAQIVLHLVLGIVCMGAAWITHFAWRLSKTKRVHWLLLWFLAAAMWLLVVNATWFPASSISQSYAAMARANWHGVRLLEVASGILALALVLTLIRAMGRIGLRSTAKWLSSAVALLIATLGALRIVDAEMAADNDRERPNIVLLGMDSLRVDALGKGNTPAIDRFLADSVVVSDTVTPLARTFASWVSIITGRHPHTTGAMTNLTPRRLVTTGDTLPQMLRKRGYHSVYTIDETRFSNLDASFGFDQAVTAPMGASDFVLAFIADTPLSNLIINTFLGRLLFPYSYGNRGAALTYDPEIFVRQLEKNLPSQRPLLLAAHLTLAHAPYTWAGEPAAPASNTSTNVAQLYTHAVARLDQQFASLIAMLEKQHVLDNAIVFVFSDHGESVGDMHQSLDGSCGTQLRCEIFGHGTTILASEQYQVVFGIRSFSNNRLSMLRPHRLGVPASLEDITPTIAELMKITSRNPFDGQSLVSVIQEAEPTQDLVRRIRFIETEFNPIGFDGLKISTARFRDISECYQVDPHSDLVTLRESDLPVMTLDRQRGALRDGDLVIAHPIGEGRFSLFHQDPEAVLHPLTPSLLRGRPDLQELVAALQHRFPEIVGRLQFDAVVNSQAHNTSSLGIP